MKQIFLIVIGAILCSNCVSLQGQNNEIDQFVNKVLQIYNKKDSEKFNELIDAKTGLYFITTIGPNNNWIHVNKVCLEQNCIKKGNAESLGIPYQGFLESYKTDNLDIQKIKYTDESFFECENILKKGVFVSSSGKYHTLSESVKFFTDSYPDIIGEELKPNKKQELDSLYSSVNKIENNSRRIEVNADGGTFVFYISKFGGDWYLTIIDFASMDCSV